MTITPSQFIVNYPAFANTTTYAPSIVQMYLNDAYLMLSAPLWNNMLDRGAQLFAAHYLVLDAQANATAANGGVPGLEVGPVSSKGVGPLSKSYDTTVGVNPDAGHWAQTMYGRRFYQMQRMVGMSGATIVPDASQGILSGPVWPGPFNAWWP